LHPGTTILVTILVEFFEILTLLSNTEIPNLKYVTSQILKFEIRIDFSLDRHTTRDFEMKFQDRKTSG